MDTSPFTTLGETGVYTLTAPIEQTVPLIFASPHSGQDYPPEFVAASRLDAATLRRSEDSFVDELFAAAPLHGAPLLAAQFPRAYLDPNREAYELDPCMFSGPLPVAANTRSPRVAAGLGTVPRVVANGAEIYRAKLTVAEAEARIERYYRPYHACLRRLIDSTCRRFGWAILVDCHSMPSVGGPMDHDMGLSRVDVVLGDCHGASCASGITRVVEAEFQRLGYRVVRNAPYAGGFTTRHYGQPATGGHALQIELNRALYMDETAHRRAPGFDRVAADITQVVAALAEAVRDGVPT